MKTTKTLLALPSGALLSTAAYAQVEVTITGSTSFRAITIDRSASLYDAGYSAVTNDASTGLITFNGTMTGHIPSLGSTPVKLRLSFSGSASGMLEGNCFSGLANGLFSPACFATSSTSGATFSRRKRGGIR